MVARSLSSGVSGMLNQQLVLDTAANNLANLTTPGFKSSRVSFSTALVQTTFAGSAPGGAIGGRNPQQAGLGVTTSSIDVDFRQGTLETTGRTLDLAVQGEGFFQITDGTRSFFSRVGNFDFDSSDSIVDQATGFRLIGNTYNLTPDATGEQAIAQIGVPLVIDRAEAFPPQRTSAVTFQGNLSADANALQGFTLQSTFPLLDRITGQAATEATALADTTIFNGAQPAAADLPIFVYGTKPNGEAYAGTFTIRPGDTPSLANGGSGGVGDLVSKINAVLAQGSERFGTVRLDNGSLIATGVGAGEGFSMFLGELDPINGTTALAGLTDATGFLFTGVSTTAIDSHTVLAAEAGMLDSVFTMPAVNYTAAPDQTGRTISLSMKINGQEKGRLTIPAADYAAVGAVRDFSFASFPHVAPGDVVTFDISGNLQMNLNSASTLTWSSEIVNDNNAANFTADVDADGFPDLFEDGSPVDANAWQYQNETNATFSWYRSRLVPEVVSSTIEVFDTQGGRHTVDARFFRTGSRIDPGNNQRINSWDMIIGANPQEGAIIDDLVAGIEFDQTGRFTGSVGTTIHGTTLNDTDFAGDPSTINVQIDWFATGPSDPPTTRMDFGLANTFTGLTGFGSASTAAAVEQDGFPDGQLDTLSVSQEGDLTALYTNGISRKLAQIELATFRNPAGLSQVGSNLLQESVNSGTANTRVAGQGAGFITAGALEGANVDIATEFTRIITAQRGFQVNARVIQTTDSLLEELANLIRG